MSTSDRVIQGIPPRRTDPKLMLARNRGEATENTPEPSAADEAEPTTAAPAPAPPAQAKKKPSFPAAAARKEPAAAPAKAPTGRISVYVDEDARARATAAFKSTAHLEGDASWSEFVERAILAEAKRREDEHNHGERFNVNPTLRRGRPLRD